MIKESPELVAVVMRWLNALQNKERDALKNMFSESAFLRYIGTDVNEVWSGKLVREGYADHAEEIPDFKIEPSLVEAFECGGAGWAFCTGELSVDGVGNSFTERFSLVFVLEAGAWKITQIHSSFPRSNLETIGVEHVVFDQLIESVKGNYSYSTIEGTTTVMFTDIVNSTSIANIVGDQIWVSTVNSHIKSLSSVIEAHDGILVKTLGDGTMSTFPSARGALAAARAIQTTVSNSKYEPEFQIRIGIHTGDVIQSEGDFFGNVINKAARIASAADPNQILVSEITRVMVGNSGDFNFGSPKLVLLRGFESSQSISELQWQNKN